jgi:hypothetical protein
MNKRYSFTLGLTILILSTLVGGCGLLPPDKYTVGFIFSSESGLKTGTADKIIRKQP